MNTRNITDAELTENADVNFLADESGMLKKMGLIYLSGLIAGGVYNTVTDPDRYPIKEGTDEGGGGQGVITPVLEVGGLNRNTGEPTSRSDAVRTADFIPVSGGTYIFSNGMGYKFCINCYDSSKAILSGWAGGGISYAYVNDGGEFSLPSSAVYLKFYCSDTADVTVPFTLTRKSGGGGSTTPSQVLEFVKQYFANGNYVLECTEMDPGLWQLEVRSAKDEFTIFNIKAPKDRPHEATVALMCSGGNTKQFADLSCMRYRETEQGQVCIICQKRGSTTPLPYFFVGFNDGAGAGRVQKFRVNPDCVPLWLTNRGIMVRRNNNYNNDWTDEETVTVDLADMHDKVEKMYAALVADGTIAG